LFRVWDTATLWVSGPANDPEINKAASRLGVTLPPSFHAFLSEFGAARLNHIELFGVGISDLRLNLLSRNLLEWPRLPRHLLLIAESVVGDRFYLSISEPTADGEYPVLLDMRNEGMREFAPSYFDFVRELCRGLLPNHEQ